MTEKEKKDDETLEELWKSVPRDNQYREDEGLTGEEIEDALGETDWMDDMPKRKNFWAGYYDE